MQTIQLAILAGRKNVQHTADLLESILPKTSFKPCVFWPDPTIPELKYPCTIVNSTGFSMSKIRNSAIAEARSRNADYLVMVEDDISVVDSNVIDLYIELMKTYSLGVVFYPFGGETNRVFDIPNYNVIVTKKIDAAEVSYITTAAKPANQFLIIDLKAVDYGFDEELKCFEFRDFLIKSKSRGTIPFLGMFFDVPNSYRYFKTIKSPRCRAVDIEIVKSEQQKLEAADRWEWKAENQISQLLKYVATKLGIECRV